MDLYVEICLKIILGCGVLFIIGLLIYAAITAYEELKETTNEQ